MKVGRLLHFISAPERTARGRGFGVHSPFAFRFMREALTQPLAYYAYPELNAAARAAGVSPKGVRALFRSALFLRPVAVEYVGRPCAAAAKALSLGNPESAACDMPFRAYAALSDGVSHVEAMWAQSDNGMLFMAPQMAVFVEWDNLPHQRFNIVLP